MIARTAEITSYFSTFGLCEGGTLPGYLISSRGAKQCPQQIEQAMVFLLTYLSLCKPQEYVGYI